MFQATFVSAQSKSKKAASQKLPNIIYIYADDLGYGELGCYGQQKIKQSGLDENTIIMFSSDNGPTFNGGVNAAFFNSAGGLRGLKMDLYEGGIREPFIARWPGKIPAGKTSGLVSAQFDMMATFAALTGQKPGHTDGISLLPELLGNSKAQTKRNYIYFEFPEKGGQVAIRMGNWKGIISLT